MYISHVLIKNYRNLVNIDIELQKVVAVIGEIINEMKRNLLPMEFYSYTITVPGKGVAGEAGDKLRRKAGAPYREKRL